MKIKADYIYNDNIEKIKSEKLIKMEIGKEIRKKRE